MAKRQVQFFATKNGAPYSVGINGSKERYRVDQDNPVTRDFELPARYEIKSEREEFEWYVVINISEFGGINMTTSDSFVKGRAIGMKLDYPRRNSSQADSAPHNEPPVNIEIDDEWPGNDA